MSVHEPEDRIRIEKLRELQFDFAIHGLENAQSLIRFLDQKAGLVITAVSILTAAIGALLIEAVRRAPTGVGGSIFRGTMGVGVLLVLSISAALV